MANSAAMGTDSRGRRNLFFNRVAITDPAYFYGRSAEMEAVFSRMVNGQSVALSGERKVGKSSLLRMLCDPAMHERYSFPESSGWTVYVDLSEVANGTPEEIFGTLLSRIRHEAESTRRAATSRSEWAGAITHVSFREFKASLSGILRDKRLVLVLDEFDTLGEITTIDHTLYAQMRSLVPDCSFVVATREPLYMGLRSARRSLFSPFFNIFDYLPPLCGLQEPEALAMLEDLSSRGGRPFLRDEKDWLIEWAGYHPFFLQLAAYELFNHLSVSEPLTGIMRPSWDVVASKYMESAEAHFTYYWEKSSAAERSVLIGIARRQTGAGGDLGHQGMPLRSLERRGLATCLGETKLFCRAFEVWLRQHLSVIAHDSAHELRGKPGARETQEQDMAGAPLRAQAQQSVFTRLKTRGEGLHPVYAALRSWTRGDGGAFELPDYVQSDRLIDEWASRRGLPAASSVERWRVLRDLLGTLINEELGPPTPLADKGTKPETVGEDRKWWLRQVVELRFIKGHTIAQTSHSLNLPTDTVSHWQREAIDRLTLAWQNLQSSLLERQK